MTHLKSLLTTIVFTAVAVGFAYAMPAVVSTAAREPAQLEPLVAPTVVPSHTPTATVPLVEEDGDKEHPENHGAAVSTAAHCPIKGKAHGELVRTIAQDKDATVADAEAACAAALAAAATEPSETKGKPAKAERVTAQRTPKPPKSPKSPKGTVTQETEVEVDSALVEDADVGGPGKGKGHNKP